MPPKRRLSANDRLRLKHLKEHQKELAKQAKEQRKCRRVEECNAATRLRKEAARQNYDSSPNVSLSTLNAHYLITPSPNSHASPSDNNPSKNDTSESNLSESDNFSESITSSNNLSESNTSIPSIKECINVIKGSNLLLIPLHWHPSTYLV